MYMRNQVKVLTKMGYLIVKKKKIPTYSKILRRLGLRSLRMPLPEFIQLEPTTKCNFNCITCTRRTLNPRRMNKDLTLHDFIKVIHQIPSVRIIKLQGLGEPLLNPYLQDILEYGSKKGIRFTTISNGSLIDNYVDMLVKYFDEIIISFDSANKRIFESIRRGSNFDKIIGNIALLTEKKKKVGRNLRLGFNVVVHHLNYNDIPLIVRMAKNVGVDFISFVEVENWKIPTEKDYVTERVFINEARRVSRLIRNLVERERIKNPDIQIYFASSDKRKGTCRWPFDSCFITADGYVTPCCIRMNPEVINFGNIFETSFIKIWNSEGYVSFRRTIIEGLPNPVCDECPD